MKQVYGDGGLLYTNFKTLSTYPMHWSGSVSQSVLHSNLTQERKPMGGVRARPLSRLFTWNARHITRHRGRYMYAILGVVLPCVQPEIYILDLNRYITDHNCVSSFCNICNYIYLFCLKGSFNNKTWTWTWTTGKKRDIGLWLFVVMCLQLVLDWKWSGKWTANTVWYQKLA